MASAEKRDALRAAAAAAAAGAIEKLHANAHLPMLLGAMGRYEATSPGAVLSQAQSPCLAPPRTPPLPSPAPPASSVAARS